jgi:hypothetical protein
MGTPRFDPTQSVEFNFDRGTVKLGGETERVVVPADTLALLLKEADSDTRREFALRLGTEAGRRAAERLLPSPSTETVVEHLGAELALMGFGSLGAEQWGKALVVTVRNSPFRGAGDELLAGVLEGALQRAFGRATTVIPLHRDDALVRLLVVSTRAASRVRDWLGGGVSWSDVLSRLNAAGGSS